MKIIRFIFAKCKLINECIENHYLLFRYRNSIRPNNGVTQNTGHVLIVKNLAYVEISVHSILSFLFHNKTSNVVIHCDDICYEKICSEYSKQILMGRIVVQNDMADSYWQLSKLKVFKSLPNESHCMFDVDTRWNGKVELESGSSYVSHLEFHFINKSPWRWLVEKHLQLENAERYIMLNTSFVRKSGDLKCSNLFLDEIFEKIFKIFDCVEIGLDDRPGVIRLAEQVAISIYLQCENSRLKALVTDGSPRSGMLFETTYFGATGNKF